MMTDPIVTDGTRGVDALTLVEKSALDNCGGDGGKSRMSAAGPPDNRTVASRGWSNVVAEHTNNDTPSAQRTHSVVDGQLESALVAPILNVTGNRERISPDVQRGC